MTISTAMINRRKCNCKCECYKNNKNKNKTRMRMNKKKKKMNIEEYTRIVALVYYIKKAQESRAELFATTLIITLSFLSSLLYPRVSLHPLYRFSRCLFVELLSPLPLVLYPGSRSAVGIRRPHSLALDAHSGRR